jgi:pimeloyl-ACP methyl ester carboxylesterase
MRELKLGANGLSFRCVAHGPRGGPLALLLHGFPEGAESWTPQLEALGAAGIHAVAPDMRGYGGTDCPEDPDDYRMPRLLDDIDGLVSALGRDRFHLAGHDWGAIVGWSYASRRPARLLTWSALSVGHPAAFAIAAREDPDQRRRSQYIRLFRMPGKAERVLSDDGHRRLRAIYASRLNDDAPPGPSPIPEAVVDAYVKGFARPHRLTAALNYYRVNMGREAIEAYPPAPDPIAAPTQLVWGDADVAVGRRGTLDTAGHVAGSYRLRVLEGAGHWLQFERPAEVSELLIEWMAGR